MVHETNSTSNRMTIDQVILQSVSITLIPAGVMLLAGLGTLFWPRPPSKNVAHAIQHLAAGVLLSAIALELIPPIAEAKERMSIVGLVIGFSMGAMVMVALPVFLDHDEDSEPVPEKTSMDQIELPRQDTVEGDDAPLRSLDSLSVSDGNPVKRSISNLGQPARSYPQSSKASSILDRLSLTRSIALRILFRSSGNHANNKETGIQKCQPTSPFPTVFAAAVIVDCLMDGLLVGISLITGASAGVFMAVAMASEMGFLGLSFAMAMTGRPKWQSVPAVAAGPFCMLIGAVVGGSISDALAGSEPLLVGCTSFGVAALLYMVTEELLVSAHEDGFGHHWWVDIQVFVGFLLAIVIAKVMEE